MPPNKYNMPKKSAGVLKVISYLCALCCMVLLLVYVQSNTTASFGLGLLSSSQLTTPISQDKYASRENKPDDNCGAWSYSLVIPTTNTTYEPLRNTWAWDNLEDGKGRVNWMHARADAPYSQGGVIHASVTYSNRTCTNVTGAFLSRIVAEEDILCSPANARKHDTGGLEYLSASSTAILSLIGFPAFGEVFPCANLWHCHAGAFLLWTGFHLAINVAKTGGLKTPTWIVALIPEAAWSGWGLDSYRVFYPSQASLLNINIDMRPAVELLSDLFDGRLILARQDATVAQLHTILEQNRAPTDIEMWISPPGPPSSGLMWDIAWDTNLSNNLGMCQNSILLQYRNDLLNAVSIEDQSNVARHVCVVSRQERDRRNLTPEFMLRLLGRLGGPLLMTPRTALRTNTSTTNGVPLYLDKSSVTGQMRFVHQECAILLGVHGAGLTNVLGLRPGTSVVELHSSKSEYQYFRNVAALMDDVDYSVFVIEPPEEVNMYTDDEGLDKLYDLIQAKLKESISRQAQYHHVQS
jgi:hypothetical protein